MKALIPQIVLLVYFQVVEWAPLFPWNDLTGGNPQRALDVAIGVAQVALIAWTAGKSRWALGVALAFYGVWLALQVVNWWIPYVFGAGDTVREAYSRLFGRTHKFLPVISDHPIPDSNHVVLHVLLVWVLAALLLAVRGRRSNDVNPGSSVAEG